MRRAHNVFPGAKLRFVPDDNKGPLEIMIDNGRVVEQEVGTILPCKRFNQSV